MNNQAITAQQVPTRQRAGFVGKLFGVRFFWIESFVFDTAGSLSEQYEGGYWEYFELSNGGFYMRPRAPERFPVQCANGFDGELSAYAFGVTCCLYAYSSLSFSPDEDFGALCANHFHHLREFALEQKEAKEILRAID